MSETIYREQHRYFLFATPQRSQSCLEYRTTKQRGYSLEMSLRVIRKRFILSLWWQRQSLEGRRYPGKRAAWIFPEFILKLVARKYCSLDSIKSPFENKLDDFYFHLQILIVSTLFYYSSGIMKNTAVLLFLLVTCNSVFKLTASISNNRIDEGRCVFSMLMCVLYGNSV